MPALGTGGSGDEVAVDLSFAAAGHYAKNLGQNKLVGLSDGPVAMAEHSPKRLGINFTCFRTGQQLLGRFLHERGTYMQQQH